MSKMLFGVSSDYFDSRPKETKAQDDWSRFFTCDKRVEDTSSGAIRLEPRPCPAIFNRAHLFRNQNAKIFNELYDKLNENRNNFGIDMDKIRQELARPLDGSFQERFQKSVVRFFGTAQRFQRLVNARPAGWQEVMELLGKLIFECQLLAVPIE